MHPEATLIPAKLVKNDDIRLPRHPVLNVNSKRL